MHQYLNLIFYKLCMQEYIKKSKTKITIKVLNIVLKKIDIGLNKILIKLLSFTKISPQCLHFNALFLIFSKQYLHSFTTSQFFPCW